MKTQIIVDKDLVILDNIGVDMDCSKFKEQFIFCKVNEKEKWIEKEPFQGKEQPEDWIEIEEFIEVAKLKSNQPNNYSVWNEDTKTWIEYTEEEIRRQEINTQIQEAKDYLVSTGWYVERLNDPSSGKAIPEDVLAKRTEARELINKLEVELGAL